MKHLEYAIREVRMNYPAPRGHITLNRHYEPTHYFETMANHPHALRVRPGDLVTTSTLDGSGRDASGEQVGPKGMPVTGPFHVEGAEPGDSLKVTFNSIVPNRSISYSGSKLAPNVLTPGYTTKDPRLGEPSIWNLTLEDLSATLESPKIGVDPFSLELRPMIGCIGVCPGQEQAFSTRASGRHGGNLGYRGTREGTTMYFPVFVEGGLLFIGGGQAAQADGKILGQGLETSMDVTFTINLVKKSGANWPRGENENEIFTFGCRRPLDEALQFATSEMVNWLLRDFRMDELSAHMIIGQFVQYEIANVFDDPYTVLCKLDKKYLP